jgi:hypothetical protein
MENIEFDFSLWFSDIPLAARIEEWAQSGREEEEVDVGNYPPAPTQDRSSALRGILSFLLRIEELVAALRDRGATPETKMKKNSPFILLDLLHLELRVGKQILMGTINQGFDIPGTETSKKERVEAI